MTRLILAEYKKVFFLRSARRYLAATAAASAAFGVLLSLTTQATTGRPFRELRPQEVLSMNLLGVDLANIMLLVFAAMSIYKEFSTQSMQVSLSITPARFRFFTAKLAAWGGLSIGVGVVTVSVAYGVSEVLLLANSMPLLSPKEAPVVQMLAGVTAMPVFYCLLTAAAAFVFWSSAGAITFSLGVLALQAVVGLLPHWVQAILLPITPQAAIHNLAGMSPHGSRADGVPRTPNARCYLPLAVA